jgi:2'-5' RNA ligase
MVKYAILAFPKFSEFDKIQKIRKKYHPEFKEIEPHVTIVCPTKTNCSEKLIDNIIHENIAEVNYFEITFKGAEQSKTEFYIQTFAKTGAEKIIALRHKIAKELSETPTRTHPPHITLGKSESKKDANKIITELKKLNINFIGKVNSIWLLKLRNNEKTLIWKKEYLLNK